MPGPAATGHYSGVRSPMLVVSDLANEFKLRHNSDREPFRFCGKKTITLREAKLCAEHFLASLQERDDEAKPKGSEQQKGKKSWTFPTLAAYDRCMLSTHMYQMKACIRQITRGIADPSLMAPDMVRLSRTGSLGTSEDERLDHIGRHAIETAQPDASIEGVNGGADGKQAEFQNEDFLERFDDEGNPPKTNGCESMGIGGCEPAAEGGVKPVDAVRALDDFAAIGVISKKNVPTLKEFVDFDQAGKRLEAGLDHDDSWTDRPLDASRK